MTQRWFIDQDDSCHWYLIKVEDKEEFSRLLEEEEYDAFEDRFCGNRIDGPHRLTFENPLEE